MATANDAEERPGFWRRQFRLPVTKQQIATDVAAGVLLPILCIGGDFFFDLGLFRPNGVLGGLFWPYVIWFYSESVIGVASISYYLLYRRASAVLSGILLGSGIFSLIVGVILVPFSLIGLMVAIGLFGFTPWLASFVFFRNARRCWLELPTTSHMRFRIITVCAAAIVIVVPLIPEAVANRIIDPPVVAPPG